VAPLSEQTVSAAVKRKIVDKRRDLVFLISLRSDTKIILMSYQTVKLSTTAKQYPAVYT